MKWSWTAILTIFVLRALLEQAVAGEIYTWTDGEGNVQITDRPPTDGSPVETVIPYSDSSGTKAPSEPVKTQNSVESQQVAKIEKQLKRLKERKAQLEKIIGENQTSIAATQKDLEHYRRRSGSYARRNEKAIERQLMMLKNNLITYQSDLRYVQDDISEAERLQKAIPQIVKRPEPGGERGIPNPAP